MVSAAFVAPFLADTTNSFLLAAARLPGVRLGLVTTASLDQVPAEIRHALAGHYQVQDGLDPQQIADGVRGLAGQIGEVERLVAILEQLQVPLGQVRDGLGIPGMGEAVALNVRDKARMKDVLKDIQDGTFTKNWVAEYEAGLPNYRKFKQADMEHPIEVVGKQLRAKMVWLAENAPKPEAQQAAAA